MMDQTLPTPYSLPSPPYSPPLPDDGPSPVSPSHSEGPVSRRAAYSSTRRDRGRRKGGEDDGGGGDDSTSAVSRPSSFSSHMHYQNTKLLRNSPNFLQVAQYNGSPPLLLQSEYLRHDRTFKFTVSGPAGQSWTSLKTPDDIQAFRLTVVSAINTSHACKGCCPYLYFVVQDVANRLPKSKERLKHGITIALRLGRKRMVNNVEAFLQNIFDLVSSPAFQRCDLSREPLIAAVSAFIAGRNSEEKRQKVVEAIRSTGERGGAGDSGRLSMKRGPISSRISSRVEGQRHSLSSALSPSSSYCMICGVLLGGGLSTLSCGHQFHDECALEHLEKEMACPVCGKSLASP